MLSLSPALAAPLFQNTATGMTVKEVLVAQPEAREVNLPGKGFSEAAPCLAMIDTYKVGSATFDACFIFEQGKLSTVRLEMKDDPAPFRYNEMLTLLRSKYGRELSETRDLLGLSAKWMTKEGTSVSLFFHDSVILQGLVIQYDTGTVEAASKL